MVSEKKKVLVLGSTGMLGSKVYEVMSKEYGSESVDRTCRDLDKDPGAQYFDVLNSSVLFSDSYDYVINCIGLIKPVVAKVGPINTLKINSIFPHELAEECKNRGTKLIHITTDCVFSGNDGNYTEDSIHDAADLYGRSKSLGEPENCLTLRTSIIGEEPFNKASLVEWAKSQEGKEVSGFVNHRWNGVTTTEFANICIRIMEQDLYREGIYHVFSSTGLKDHVSKCVLLHLLNARFNLDLKIKSVEAPNSVNRVLSTKKELNDLLNIPLLEEQIMEM